MAEAVFKFPLVVDGRPVTSVDVPLCPDFRQVLVQDGVPMLYAIVRITPTLVKYRIFCRPTGLHLPEESKAYLGTTMHDVDGPDDSFLKAVRDTPGMPTCSPGLPRYGRDALVLHWFYGREIEQPIA